MKALLIAALLVSTAHAETVMTMPNDGGTDVRFTDESCPSDATKRFVYTTIKGGQVLTGCYAYVDEMMVTTWETGAVYAYPVGHLTITEYGQQKYGAE